MVGKAGITTSTNEAYGKVKTGAAAADEGYEMVDISPATPAKLEEMYEVPSSLNQPLPSPPSSPPSPFPPGPPPPSPPGPPPSPPSSPPSPSHPGPPGPSPPGPAFAGAEDEVVYDFITGDQ